MTHIIPPSKSRIMFFLLLSCALLGSWLYASGESKPRSISSEFQIKLLDETVVTYKDLLGKVTVIEFWGTWCKPCLEEIPAHNAFCRDYISRGVSFIALAVDSGEPKEVKKAAKKLKINYPIGAPSKEELKTIGQIRAYPTTWVIGPSGEITKEIVGVGYAKKTMIREGVDRLLEK
jgi:thiol-disulfide isomerase/thioredoxin